VFADMLPAAVVQKRKMRENWRGGKGKGRSGPLVPKYYYRKEPLDNSSGSDAYLAHGNVQCG